MLILITIVDHFIYLFVGRALVERSEKSGAIFYARWFIASASVYYICWFLLGYISIYFRVKASQSIIHLIIGFILLIVLDVAHFRAPRTVKRSWHDILRLIKSLFQVFREASSQTRVLKYFVVVLLFGYGYFIYKGLSVPPYEYDVLSYHLPLAQDFFSSSVFIPQFDRYWHFYFPANFELWLSQWYGMGRTSIIALAQLPSIFLVALMGYTLSRSLGLAKPESLLASCVLISAPIIMFQSITPMSELFSLPFLIGVLLFSIEYLKNREIDNAFLAGLSLALAVGTKYSYLTLIPSIPVAVLIGLVISHGINSQIIKKWLVFVLCELMAIIAVSSFWYARNLGLKDNPVFPFELNIFGKTIFHGISPVFDPNFELNFVSSKLHWLIYPFVEGKYSAIQGWGYVAGAIGTIGMILILLSDLKNKSRRHISAFILIFLVSTIFLWWKLTQHEPRFLIFILPLLSLYSVYLLSLWKAPFKLNYLLLLLIFCVTIGKSIGTIKSDIRNLAYDGNFAQFYGLPAEFDNWTDSGITILFSEKPYGHLLVYPLSGKNLNRRVIVVGVERIRDESELTRMIHRYSGVFFSVDHVIYQYSGNSPKIDIEKVADLEIEGIHRFSFSRSRFILAEPHKIISYRVVSKE